MSKEVLQLLVAGMLDKLGGEFRINEADAERIGHVNLRVFVDEKTGEVVAQFVGDDEARLLRQRPYGTS